MKRKSKSKRSLFTKIVLLINSFAVLLLLLSYLAPLIKPELFWPFAFLGLAYPLLLLINFLFIVYWIIRKKYYFIISLFAVLLGYQQVGNFFQWNRTSAELNDEKQLISVLSYNVRVFDIYNYGANWEHRFENRNNIFDYLTENDFDIICFQEFVHDKSGVFKTKDTLSDFLRAKHFHGEFTRSSRDVNFFGLATYSAYPIVNRGKILFETHGGNLCIYTDILVNNDTVRVYNVHLESIGLSPEDHIFVENMINVSQNGNEEIKSSGRKIIGRMKAAFIRRSAQANKIAAHIAECPFPIVMAGDFNDTPSSYVYKTFSKHLNDSFKKGRGTGQTYIGPIPGFRIDYIMHSDEFETLKYNTGKEEYSDHYPIWALLMKK